MAKLIYMNLTLPIKNIYDNYMLVSERINVETSALIVFVNLQLT